MTLFQWMTAGGSPPLLALLAAVGLASGGAALAALAVAVAAWRRPRDRPYLFGAAMVCAGVSVFARALASALAMPRPFTLGLAPVWIEHGASASLPSTHASVMFTIAFICLARPSLRPFAAVLVALSVATGWARIYVGVHFPIDVLAGLALGLAMAASYAAGWTALVRAATTFGRRHVPKADAQGVSRTHVVR